MDLARVDVVLVRSARAANVAAAARALKNMGLGAMTLVAPPPELEQSEARKVAYGAWDVLDAAPRKATLEEAVADATFVAATTGRVEVGAWTARRLAEEAADHMAGGRLAIVFGPEASGLTNRELARSHVRVHVPCDAGHPSLNLAQAVLLVGYELRMAALLAAPPPAPLGRDDRATAGDIEAALGDLERGLLGIGYLNPHNPESILAEMRALVVRARPTRREATLLRGLARQVQWAAAQIARPSGRDDNPPPEGGLA